MFCGLCTEVCPTGSIRHSTEFEASSANIINMVLHYVRYGDKAPVYKPVKDQEPESIPQNEAFRQVHKNWDTPPPLDSDTVRGKVRWKSGKSGRDKSS
jgi:formate hydrogenlyase subunit 6/NADH:ubiquinone oxidoreductase subunit I